MALDILNRWDVFVSEVVTEEFSVPRNIPIVIVLCRQDISGIRLVIALVQPFQRTGPYGIGLNVESHSSAWFCGGI